jgi:hypothetical protein
VLQLLPTRVQPSAITNCRICSNLISNRYFKILPFVPIVEDLKLITIEESKHMGEHGKTILHTLIS